jgi:hypothetical protein
MATPPTAVVRHDISDDDIEKNAKEIDSILRGLQRPGIENRADWLKTTDFYTAPASSKFHLNSVGGLAAHSLNVYHCLQKMVADGLVSLDPETVALTALLHDLCKANFYKREVRPVFEDGEMRNCEVWVIEDPFPVGHGEKSCYYVQRYIQLTEEEYAMIRLHMGSPSGSFPDPFIASSELYPGVAALHIADSMSALLIENRP